jgi:hypothetical protein
VKSSKVSEVATKFQFPKIVWIVWIVPTREKVSEKLNNFQNLKN